MEVTMKQNADLLGRMVPSAPSFPHIVWSSNLPYSFSSFIHVIQKAQL